MGRSANRRADGTLPEANRRQQRAGWTDTGMTEAQRAFCMGNALVTDVVHRIGEAMCKVCDL